MSHLLLILISALLVNNVVLTQFLGLCPMMGASRRLDTALGLGMATLFVMTLATITTFFVNTTILVPLGAGHLKTLVFIGLIAAVVQASELAMKAYSPRLFEALGLYLPLITTNCAVLGVTLLSARKEATLFETLFFSLGASLGFVLVLALFSSMRERIEIADVPRPFQGAAIGLITAGIAAIAFSGFSGLLRT